MRSIEEIKRSYISDPKFGGPCRDEIEYYGFNDDIYKEWITEKLLNYQKKLLKEINHFKNIKNPIKKLEIEKFRLFDFAYFFDFCMENYPASDSYYYELPELVKKIYDNDMFDYLSYDDLRMRMFRFANLVYYVRPEDHGFTVDWDCGKKYTGMLIQVYYHNPKVFEELLMYFLNVIYQKYGLYLQYDMNILTQFCYEYNLLYMNLLEEAHKKAMKLDYPSNHEFKYQFYDRLNVKWKENVLELRPLEKLKDNYLNDQDSKPTRHEMEYYKITEDVLEQWLKDKI